MRTVFYVIWLGIPAIFFTLALWSKLEAFSGRAKKDRPDDLVRQGGFLLLCSICALIIDYYLIEDLYANVSPDWIPLGFYRLILLPFIFLIAGKLIGPSDDILISKAPQTSRRKKKR